MKIIVLVATIFVLTLALGASFKSKGQDQKQDHGSSHVTQTVPTPEDQTSTEASERQEVQLLEIGSHYEQSEVAGSGKWLAWDSENSMLTECEMKLTSDPDYGDSKRVDVQLPFEAMMLVRGGGLTAGPIVTLYKSNWDQPLSEKTLLNLELGNANYELKVTKSEDTGKCEHEGLPMNGRLLLTSGDSRQVLYSLVDCGDGSWWHVIWAGDIDRDGKLDLLLNLGQSDYDGSLRLFLSSKATNGRLVKQVAELMSDGC